MQLQQHLLSVLTRLAQLLKQEVGINSFSLLCVTGCNKQYDKDDTNKSCL